MPVYPKGNVWIYQSRIIFTQTNAAGGAIVADYSVATGQIARLVSLRALNSGNNGISVDLVDEDNAASCRYALIGAGAATLCHLPSIGQSATATGAIASSEYLLTPPGAKLSIYQSAAGAQNDTLTIALTLELWNLPTEPTISKARSTNAADVTQGTDSISDANDLVQVRHP